MPSGPAGVDDQVIATERLDLILFTPPLLEAVLAGRTTSIAGVGLSADWIRRSERVLRRRLDQITRDPDSAAWLLRAMVGRESGELIGRIGFHGKPGDNSLAAANAVELGYTVEPAFRRQGYAEEAIGGMMGWARRRSVDHFLLSIGPTNSASLGLAAKLGFAEVARVMDEEDGPEIVFQLPAPAGADTARDTP